MRPTLAESRQPSAARSVRSTSHGKGRNMATRIFAAALAAVLAVPVFALAADDADPSFETITCEVAGYRLVLEESGRFTIAERKGPTTQGQASRAEMDAVRAGPLTNRQWKYIEDQVRRTTLVRLSSAP